MPYDFIYLCNLINKINKQNRNRLIDNREQADRCRGMGHWGLGKIGEKIKKKINLIDIDISIMITRAGRRTGRKG